MDTILLRRASLLACGLSLIMLSVLAAAAQPLSPADEAHRVLLPLVLKSELPVGITNGDFEDGHTAWDEYSQRGYPLIYHRSASDFPPLDPHSGDWLAWLGGGHNEVSRLSQTFTIPASATRLSYYLWIASEDFCSPDYDIWRLIVDADNHVTPDDILDGYPLCEDSSTPGWIRREVDITRGRMVGFEPTIFWATTRRVNPYTTSAIMPVQSTTAAEEGQIRVTLVSSPAPRQGTLTARNLNGSPARSSWPA
jgi:hypothetical protein